MSDIDSLPNVIKLARENAILGNYEESIKSYNEGVTIVQTFLISQTAKTSKEQWKFVESSILLELTNVKEILSINEGFTANFGSGAKPSINAGYRRIKTNTESTPVDLSGYDNNFAMKPPLPLPVQRKAPNFERFGGAEPFSHQKGEPYQYYGRDIDDYEEEGKNFFVNQRNKKYYDNDKDPDVWDPPSPPKYENYRKRQASKWNSSKRNRGKVGSVSRPPIAPPSGGARKVGGFEEKKRSYEKPWNSGVKTKSTSKDTDSYLYHCYPDGVGPDTELISMLEKDVLDKNPQVSFDDKSILINLNNLEMQ